VEMPVTNQCVKRGADTAHVRRGTDHDAAARAARLPTPTAEQAALIARLLVLTRRQATPKGLLPEYGRSEGKPLASLPEASGWWAR